MSIIARYYGEILAEYNINKSLIIPKNNYKYNDINLFLRIYSYIHNNKYNFSISKFIEYINSFNIYKFELLDVQFTKNNLSWSEYFKTNYWQNQLNLINNISNDKILFTALLAFICHWDSPKDAAYASIYYGGDNISSICKLTCELATALHGIEWIPIIFRQYINFHL